MVKPLLTFIIHVRKTDRQRKEVAVIFPQAVLGALDVATMGITTGTLMGVLLVGWLSLGLLIEDMNGILRNRKSPVEAVPDDRC
jgi:hypothetical protein